MQYKKELLCFNRMNSVRVEYTLLLIESPVPFELKSILPSILLCPASDDCVNDFINQNRVPKLEEIMDKYRRNKKNRENENKRAKSWRRRGEIMEKSRKNWQNQNLFIAVSPFFFSVVHFLS